MTILFSFPDQIALGTTLSAQTGFETGAWEMRRFPDGDSYVRILSDIKRKDAVILCSLNQPDDKIMPLIFLARSLKELGCPKVTLIAPYLGYMRQDKRFKEGEAITSTIFASLLSGFIDALVTIDPHLHRHKTLEEIYSCACVPLSAAPLMAPWIAEHVAAPLLIGPDGESEQWVSQIAAQLKAPFVILEKRRQGDRDVSISLPAIDAFAGRTPVLVDDIISTATTMITTIGLLCQHGFAAPVCLATHGVFADDSYEKLRQAGGARIVTANTLPHASNGMDVAPILAAPFDVRPKDGSSRPLPA